MLNPDTYQIWLTSYSPVASLMFNITSQGLTLTSWVCMNDMNGRQWGVHTPNPIQALDRSSSASLSPFQTVWVGKHINKTYFEVYQLVSPLPVFDCIGNSGDRDRQSWLLVVDLGTLTNPVSGIGKYSQTTAFS